MITVNGKQMDWRSGLTVEAILKELKNDYPIVVKVNNKPIMKKQYKTFKVPDNAIVNIIEIIAGG